MNPPKTLLRRTEAMALLDVKRATWDRLVTAGDVRPTHLFGGGRAFYLRAELETLTARWKSPARAAA